MPNSIELHDNGGLTQWENVMIAAIVISYGLFGFGFGVGINQELDKPNSGIPLVTAIFWPVILIVALGSSLARILA